MDLTELLGALWEIGSTVLAIPVPDAGSVVVLPAPKTGTNWSQVAAQVGGTALVGLLAVYVARKNHRDTVAHDRSMRFKDDLRDVLGSALDTMGAALDAQRALEAIQHLRHDLQLRDMARLQQTTTYDDVPDRKPGHQRLMKKVTAADAEFDAAEQAMRGTLNRLRLFVAEGDPLIQSYNGCRTALLSALADLRTNNVETNEPPSIPLNLVLAERKAVKRARQRAHDLADAFSVEAQAVVRGDQTRPSWRDRWRRVKT